MKSRKIPIDTLQEFCVFFFAIAVLCAPMYAQETKSKTKAKADTMHYNTQMITVTANRLPAENINVPAAVSVVPKEQFQNNRGFGLDEALSLVPGALVQSRAGNQDVRVMVRGFGARGAGQRSNAGTSRGIRFYVDGLPLTEPDGRTSFDLLDLSTASSIEVIRSNTSALWGNASGAVVNIRTTPQQDGHFATAGNSIGSFGYMKQYTSMGTQIGSSKVWANVSNTTFDGWRAHSASSWFMASAGVEAQLAPKTRLGVIASAASNMFRIPGPLTQAQYDADPSQAQNDTIAYNPTFVTRDERRYNRIGRLGMTLDHELADGHSITSSVFAEPKYLQRSERNTFRDFTRYHFGGSFVYNFKTDISSDIQSHFMTGVDDQYQDGAIIFYNLNPLTAGRGTTVADNKREGANNFGFFFQELLRINSSLTVLLGGRIDRISYYSQNYLNPKIDQDKVFSQFSPKLSVSYSLSNNMAVYALYSSGVEVPAGNETDPSSTVLQDSVHSINSLLDPIRSNTIELGLKHMINIDGSFLRALSYDVAIYNIGIKNELIPYRGGRFYMSAGESKRTGVEVGATLSTQIGLSLMASFSYASNILSSYVIDSSFVNASLAGRTLDLSNNKAPGIPQMFSTLRLRYVPTFLSQAFVEAEFRTVGEYFVNDVNTTKASAYSVVDIGAGYDLAITDNLSVRANVRMNNAADTKYVSSVWINPDLSATGAPVFIEPGLARNFLANIALNVRW